MTTKKPTAASNYRQVRLTFTDQPNGMVGVRVMVKPLQAEWHHKHTILAESFWNSVPLGSMQDVYAFLVDYLGQYMLPESHT